MNDLSIYYQNVRGINTKIDVFTRNLALSDYDIFTLSETWLSNNVTDAEFGLCANYQVFRCDRCSIRGTGIRGGGVLIAVKNKFPSRRLHLNNNSIEQLYIEISINSFSLIIGTVYLPPRSDIAVYNNHFDLLDNLMSNNPNSKFLILGDYNLPNIQWITVNNNIIPDLSNVNNFNSNILTSLSYINLTQHNLVYNRSGSMLDLVFSNINNVIVSPVMYPLVPIDQM